MSQAPRKELEIAIIGGGVCGLGCAIALAQEGIVTHVYEASAKFGEIGAGIGIGPNAVEILQAIGVWDDVLSKVIGSGHVNLHSDWMQYRSGKEGSELIYDYPLAPGEIGVGMHRAVFLDVLVNHLDPKFTHCHMNKRCIAVSSVDESSKLTISFSDATQATADVVLGADGIKSVVRGAVTHDDPRKNMVFSNSICYRGLIPIDSYRAACIQTDLTKGRPVCFLGRNKHVVASCIKGGQLINVAAVVTDPRADFRAAGHDTELDYAGVKPQDVTSQELLENSGEWGSDVQKLIGCIQMPDKWNVNVVYPPLESYTSGRIALLGDAAHAMLPYLGAGAAQGLEDGFLLAKLLGHEQTTLSNVEQVLHAYDAVRRPRASRVWNDSLRAGNVYDLVGYDSDEPTPEEIRRNLSGITDFVWHHRIEDDVESAVKHLQMLGVFAV